MSFVSSFLYFFCLICPCLHPLPLFVLSFPSFTFFAPFFVSHVFRSFISCCFLSSSLSHLPSFFLIFHFLCSIALSPTFIFCFLLFFKSISCPLAPPFGSNLPLFVLSCYFTFLPFLPSLLFLAYPTLFLFLSISSLPLLSCNFSSHLFSFSPARHLF